MKFSRVHFFSFVLLLSFVLSACGAAVPQADVLAPDAASTGSETAPVEFAGQLEAIDGEFWTVSGQVVRVSAETQLERQFQVGEHVQVSAQVQSNGDVVASEVQSFVQTQAQTQTQTQADAQVQVQSQFGTVAADVAPSNTQTQTQIQSQTQAQAAAEFTGQVEAINGDQWTIGGQVFTVTAQTEFKNQVQVGDMVKVHLSSSGTVIEIGLAQAGATAGFDDNGNSSDDSGNDSISDQNDDHGSDDDSGSDDHGSDDNGSDNSGSDDHGGNSGSGSDD